ncbi:hypothetical protein PHLCEN_2v6292 [Hermanssonia centrifuga]|uniref:Uncharacterized protein n=1 Tax=Hermanssonia centrifuga TaxID=98765 RepID=A0A2R6NZU8_9APHY|nr:hypothetical protein PHLCEN_2v6292 [Hermanssonia centrifuga]
MPLHPSTFPDKNRFKLARYVVSKISSLVKSLASQRSLNVRPVSHQAVEHPPSIYQAPRDVIPDWQSDDERTLVSSPLSISFLDEDKKAKQGGPTASAAKHVPFQEVLDRWERHPYLVLDINAMTLTHKGTSTSLDLVTQLSHQDSGQVQITPQQPRGRENPCRASVYSTTKSRLKRVGPYAVISV